MPSNVTPAADPPDPVPDTKPIVIGSATAEEKQQRPEARMDLNQLREAAIEATARALVEKTGAVPNEESEEWEEEYRRQFVILKSRAERAPAAAAPPAPSEAPPLPELSGPPKMLRWAAELRAARLKEIRDPEIRRWLIATWTKAKSWLDTRELSTPVFLQRIEPHYRDYRRRDEERAKEAAAKKAAEEKAEEELRRQLADAGVTPENLVELVDASERHPPVPIRDKLAELAVEGRNLRLFETADPAFLMVLEKSPEGRSEYAIPRDPGLFADLELYGRAKELL